MLALCWVYMGVQNQMRLLLSGSGVFFKTPFPGRISIPTSFVSLFIFYILSYLLLKTMGCFYGCLMSSASIQKLFCGICSALKCSFDPHDSTLGESSREAQSGRRLLGTNGGSLWLWCCLAQPGTSLETQLAAAQACVAQAEASIAQAACGT